MGTSRELDLQTVRAKLSSIARSLEMHELTRQEASVERVRVQHAASVQQAIINERYMNGVAVANELETIRADVEALQQERQHSQRLLIGYNHDREEAEKYQAHLHELLLQQRRTLQRLEAEGTSLRAAAQGQSLGTWAASPSRIAPASVGL